MESRRPHGGLEAAVLDVLAVADAPMSTADVRGVLGADLAYTTVLTVLSRLAEKGQVERVRRGRAHVYSIASQSQVTAARMRKLLDADQDRAAALARFVGELSDADERLLIDMLRASDLPEP